MVKLTGPHFSITALGKFGKVTVYSIWKGIQYARMLVTPANPKTSGQADVRLMLGGLGRAPKYVQSESNYWDYAKAVAPAGQSWISKFVQYMRDEVLKDVATFDAFQAEVVAHAAAADWLSEAVALGLIPFDYTGRTAANEFMERSMLYALAKYGVNQYNLDNIKFAVSPYTTALASWTLTEIQEMVADFSA